MRITEQVREQHLEDMQSFMADCRKQNNKFPRDKEIAKVCGISIHSVVNYRKIIAQRTEKILVNRFAIEKVQSIEDSIDTFYDHINWYKTLYEDEDEGTEMRMNAAKLIEEAQKSITEIMVDSPMMIGNIEMPESIKSKDNVLFYKEHLHGKEERITAGIKSITD